MTVSFRFIYPDFAGLENVRKFHSLTGKFLLSSLRAEDRRSRITIR
jgi:hypothetical protein